MKPKALCPFSPEELRSYSVEHLWYEVWMFFATGATIPYGASSPAVKFIDNAVIESFAIHLRNLLDFFYPNKKCKLHPDDVIAAYYFDTGELPSNFPRQSPFLKDVESRAHKQVSHLTSKRLTGDHPEKQWHPVQLMREISELLLAFVEGASPEKLAPEFVEQIKAILTTNSAITTRGTE